MPKRLPNIEYTNEPYNKSNPVVDSPIANMYLPYYKNEDYFFSLEKFTSFVKGCERLFRKTKYYKRYIKTVKSLNLNFCQVLPNVVDDQEDEDGKKKQKKFGRVTVELHHGPIFTLFDYASIITEYLLANNKPVNSFIVADILVDEHFAHNIQFVMLSKTMHEAVHNGDIFIALDQGIGNIQAFLNKYWSVLTSEHITAIKNYIELSKREGSFDKGVLDVEKTVTKWEDKFGEIPFFNIY